MEALGGEALEDKEFAGLDDKARDKSIAQDKLKAKKVKEALEKSRLKDVEKNKKLDEKAKREDREGQIKDREGKGQEDQCTWWGNLYSFGWNIAT